MIEEDEKEKEKAKANNLIGEVVGCRHILTTGKNKDTSCGCLKIYCNKMCLKHHKMSVVANQKKYGDYGNPDQADLWVKWVMSGP